MGMNDLLERISRLEDGPSNEPVVPEPELIGFFVRWVRGLRQWKQSTLADFAGVSVSTVERVERGEKVSDEALESIGQALGYERGYFTAPRHRIALEEAAAEVAERFGEIEPVAVRAFRTQRQVRELAMCDAFLVHRPALNEEYDGNVAELTEWLDLASFILSEPDRREKGRRRELYNSILACVRRFEERGITILAGVMNAPQDGIPDWKVAIISLTPKLSDPGAPKRRFILVERGCVAIRKPPFSSQDA